jgi:uncharacterized membrane protein YeaQ/YmgE (transglycosylase-associated protein family)
MEIVYFLLIGAIAGWLAGQLMKGRGFGLVGNIVIGILGAVIGGFLFRQFGASSDGGLVGSLVVALVGAIVLLLIVGALKKA